MSGIKNALFIGMGKIFYDRQGQAIRKGDTGKLVEKQ